MPIHHDQTARDEHGAPKHDASEAAGHREVGNLTDEMRAIMKLIASQIDDADRQHSETLTQMYDRLHELGHEAQISRAKSPTSYAPAFDRIREGIEQLAKLVGQSDRAQATDPETDRGADPGAAATDQKLSDHLNRIRVADVEDTRNEDMMITDNAADRMQYAYDEFDEPSVSSDGEAHAEHEPAAPSAHAHSAPAGFAHPAHESRAPVTERDAALAPNSVAGDADQPWDLASAEALTRVYEEEMGRVDRAPEVSQSAMMTAAPSAARPAMHKPEAFGMDVPAYSKGPSFDFDTTGSAAKPEKDCAGSCISSVSPAIEQAWLEERFTEIAAKIEETFAELRDDEALHALSARFGDFEQRMGHALEDVATRQDLDALKAAEDQIDSMVGYFERVEDKLARIDNLEAQMEALLDRFSDDRLLELIQSNGQEAGVDYSAIANAAAESAAQRFLADFKSEDSGDEHAIVEMREALEAFIAERRDHEHEAAGMLDTIQQALIRVLDRVETLESGFENVPMTDPRGEDFADEVAELQHDEEIAGPVADIDLGAEISNEDEEANADSAFETHFEPEPAPSHEPENYAQRLEYPAAVQGGRGDGGIPEPYRAEAPVAHAAAEPALAEAAEDQVFGADKPFEAAHLDVPAEASFPAPEMDEQPPYAPYPQDFPEAHNEPAPQRPAAQPPHQPAEAQAPNNAIERLRREFIEDAKRARERATQQASEGAVQAAQSNSIVGKLAVPSLPGLSGLSLKIPGIGKSEQSPVPPAMPPVPPTRQPRAPAAAETHLAGDGPAPKARFAMPRSKILVGAVIVLFATAGALLMMRGKSQPVETAPPPAIEQSVEPHGDSPELTGPEIQKPAAPSDDRRGSLEEGRVYDDGLQYDITPPVSNSHAMNDTPAGVAVAGLDRGVNLGAINKAQNQRALAKLSSDLGAAAAYASPATLIEQSKTPQAVAAAPLTSSAKGNQLDLPPATVGPLSLRLAAAKGDPSAQFEVAARMAGGTGTKQDLKGAVRWYKMSAAQGFAQAQYRLGTLYERGLGVEKDLTRASAWYTRAAQAGNVKAMHNLAVVSVNRTEGGSDYDNASKWFAKAAEYGLGDSQYNMAVLHENGLGATKDLSKAYFYYALAAHKGDPQAAKQRDATRVKLSPGALSEVEKQVKNFRPKRADRLVNDARTAGEDWKKRAEQTY